LCLKTTKNFSSKRKIWFQRTSRFVFCCSSSFDWRFNFFWRKHDVFFFRFLRVQNRFKRLHVIQFIFFIDFYFTLKLLNEMIFFAIDAFSFFDRCIANVFVMKIRTSCVTLIVFTRFIYMFVTLIIKTLFYFTIFVEIFACSMRIFIE
jgi:hypothetical protein